jgi:cystathionine beta-lyase
VAHWLQQQPQVARVLYPALPGHPGHEIWKRDCHGCNGLLSFEFKAAEQSQVDRFVSALKLFGIGYSWGGYESLVTQVELRGTRSVADWSQNGLMLRLHVGLESPADLIADLAAGFAVLG